ncbi:hypothetical protein BJV78DRAFT_1215393 [Lactifluus subvellereus]|nr:hypothetical protein BJV78DRAFT_1215393 [Lactifluus subvellereus]
MGIFATNATNTIGDGPLTIANDLRVASLSIAAYDYLLTLLMEYRLYRSSASDRCMLLILFILIRYSSIMVLVSSNVGFFYHHFSPKSCHHYFRVTPIFKLIQLMVSQAILGVRTYSISQQNDRVRWTVVAAYFATVGFQSFSALVNRIPVMVNGNCMIGNSHPTWLLSNWTIYLAALLYDCLVLSISTVYLLKLGTTEASAAPGPKPRLFKRVVSALTHFSASRLMKMLLFDGLGYFVALTVVNVANIFLFRNTNPLIQSSGASLNYAVTWIMSQRILIHPYKVKARQTTTQQPTLRGNLPPTSGLRFSRGTKSEGTVNGASSSGSRTDFIDTRNDLDLRSRVEQSVALSLKTEDIESIEKDIDAPPESAGDPGSAV